MKLRALALIAGTLGATAHCSSIFAQAGAPPVLSPLDGPPTGPTPFDALMGANSGACLSMDKVAALATDGLATLTDQQFQFVRAAYIFIPPVSRELPPGDHAFLAKSGSYVLVGLSGDGIVEGKPDANANCARFIAPPFVVKMLLEIGKGQNGNVGEKL